MNPNPLRRRHFFKAVAVFTARGIIFLCLASAAAVLAAEPAKPSVPLSDTKQPAAVAASIPAAEIIPRAEQALRTLHDIRFDTAADSDVSLNTLQREISAFAKKSDQRWQVEAEAIKRVRSLQRVNDVLREWSLEQSQLDSWDRALARRSQILVAQEDDTSQIFDTWQTTRGTGKQQGFPKVALEKVTEVLREADAVRGLIRDSMARLLNLQIQIANRRDILAKIRSDIDRAREQSGRELFVLDSPPLWEAFFRPQARDAIAEQALQSSERFVEDLQEFVQKYRYRFLWHALFVLALVPLFRFLRRGLTPQATERFVGSFDLFLLDRSFASSFLLAVIGLPIFYPGAPTAVLRIAAFPTVIPVIRLLPLLLPRIFRRWVYMLVTLYVLDFWRYVLPAAGLMSRVLLMVIALGGCVGLGFFLHLRGASLSASSRGRFVRFFVRLIFLLFAASAVSNFVGNTTLAEILVATPIRVTYAGALIFAGAHLLMTLSVVLLQSQAARGLRSVRRHGEWITLRCRTIIRFIAIIFWVGICLNLIGISGDISAAAADFLQLRWKLGAAEISIENLAVFIAVILSFMIFSRLLRFVLTEEVLPRIPLPRGVPGAVDVLSRYGVLLLGFFIALAAAGVDLSKVTLLVSALGVGIGFGLQNVVNNFVSGLILVFEHPVQVGDIVEVGNISGEVRKIGFRASVLRTPDGAEVIIPNGELVGNRFSNWSLSDRLRRITIPVTVAHGTDPNRVIEILLAVARKNPAVLADPAPLAVFDRFGESALNFTLLCWSFVDNFFLARSELTIEVNNAFKEAGINIPFPQQDVHVHWSDGQGPLTETSITQTAPDTAVVAAQKPVAKAK